MKRNNKAHALAVACLLLGGGFVISSAPPAIAQSGSSSSSLSQRIIKTQFVVERMSNQSLQVRDIDPVPALHTFSYSPAIRDKMQKIFDSGGYQFGDRVAIWYRSGTNIALNIKGKPSKSK